MPDGAGSFSFNQYLIVDEIYCAHWPPRRPIDCGSRGGCVHLLASHARCVKNLQEDAGYVGIRQPLLRIVTNRTVNRTAPGVAPSQAIRASAYVRKMLSNGGAIDVRSLLQKR
ncbi:MAG: hypothetical protein ACREFP_21125 [Acetobacteraceae bacterium]